MSPVRPMLKPNEGSASNMCCLAVRRSESHSAKEKACRANPDRQGGANQSSERP